MSRAETFLRSVASRQVVTSGRLSESGWVLDNGELRHGSADFFRVIGARDHDGVEHLLFDQPEAALVGLVVTGPPGRRRVLVNARAEPGLHEGAQFSATVQSSPSNYEQRHGGKPTPFLGEILHLANNARVIHDSVQYDWGRYYRAKTKRFRVIEIDDETPAPVPLLWVNHDELDLLLRSDRRTTVDLRCIALALRCSDAGLSSVTTVTPERESEKALEQVSLTSLTRWVLDDEGVHDSRGERSVHWFTTQTSTREIERWTQPLMVLDRDVSIVATVRRENGRILLAVRRETAVGLEGRMVWGLAENVGSGSSSRPVMLSAEGGRFFRHGVSLALSDNERAIDEAVWMSREEALALVTADLCTSLEFRLAVGLLETKENSW